MKKLIAVVLPLLVLLALAAPAPAKPKGCEGPADLCKQILELNQKLEEAKAVSAQKTVEVAKKTDEVKQVEVKAEQKVAEVKVAETKKTEEKVAEVKEEEKKDTGDRMARTIAVAASLAVGLKLLLSFLDKWKGFFTGSRGKALLKVVTLVVGLFAFIATNVGLGIPFWQSLILAGGGPGAILVHELTGIIPVLRGDKKNIPPDLRSEPPGPESKA